MTPRPLLTIAAATTAAVLGGAAAAAPAGAAETALYNPRPHADLALRDAGLRIARFDVYARPHDGRVRIGVTLTARSRTRDVVAVLRIGRCTGGPPTLPVCDPNANQVARFHANRTTIVHMTALVPRPAAHANAIRISLTPRGRIVRPHSDPRAAIADMLLPASAWTAFGTLAWGVRVARPWEGDGLPNDLRAITARAAQIDRGRLRATLHWSANAPAGTTVTTAAGPCVTEGPACAAFSRPTTAKTDGAATFAARPTLRRSGDHPVMLVNASTPDGYLFSVKMPWPR